ncbi:hypothetical protein [Bacillus pseudomycoides]|nr:hypothetical protein [Bacillus pseudomycoides]MEB3053071.1 hypothetical protein [Bacillus pseudomycoides]PEB40164.1 hypothetical protein COO06_18775 [Bacillus pseudomycoides]PEE05269.1 hypothetical protein CON86_16945 [Bacillus pseudomycoides]PEM80501.1 hypothetical protein CN632_02250 [Bacillus pseudomycoides]PGD90156.1 hypothetical protein COM50_26155 [Bacillus pseudomycoides]
MRKLSNMAIASIIVSVGLGMTIYYMQKAENKPVEGKLQAIYEIALNLEGIKEEILDEQREKQIEISNEIRKKIEDIKTEHIISSNDLK